MSQSFDKTQLYAAKGPAYRQAQLSDNSYYNDPISHMAGELSGNSRRHGDASHNVQQHAIDAIKTSGKKHGMTEHEIALTLSIARTESGFNPDAAAGTTSATGLGQFINSTGAKYGITDANRWNINVQADALVRHTKENITLAKKKGYTGKDIDRYTYKFHHDGPSKDYGGLDIADKHVVPQIILFEQYLKSEKPDVEHKPQRNNKTMGRPFILVGDKTDHGGVVVEGSPQTNVMGRPVARVGDRVTCPKKGHDSNNVIVSGDPAVIVEGRPVARHGDKAACGATLVSSQVSTTAPG